MKELKALALRLGFTEDDIDGDTQSELQKKVDNRIDKLNKIANKKGKGKDDDEEEVDDDEEEETENIENDDDKGKVTMKMHNDLKKSHNDLKKSHAKLCNRCDTMEKTLNKMVKNSTNDRVNDFIEGLLASGKLENKQEAIDEAREALKSNYALASSLYNKMPAIHTKVVKDTDTGKVVVTADGKKVIYAKRIDDVINTAEKEHEKNKAAANKDTKDAENGNTTGKSNLEKTGVEADEEPIDILNEDGQKVGVGMAKRITTADAKREAGIIK